MEPAEVSAPTVSFPSFQKIEWTCSLNVYFQCYIVRKLNIFQRFWLHLVASAVMHLKDHDRIPFFDVLPELL